MATKNGVYQLDNGFWAYRFSIIIDGKRISRKKTTDEYGNKLNTQAAAAKARAAAKKSVLHLFRVFLITLYPSPARS